MSLNYLRLSIFPWFLSLLLAGPVLFADTTDDLEETRSNLLEVVKLRETLANEQRAWREQKPLMEGQVRLDQAALGQFEAQLAEAEPQLEALLRQSTELKADIEATTQLIDFWKGKLEILTGRLTGVLARFPPALRRELEAKLREIKSIDAGENPTKMRRQFDLCLELLSEANEYHREIHIHTEVHPLPDGKRGEFTVVNLGLSGGYYFSEKSGTAGIIRWSGDDWQWVENEGLLKELVTLESILAGQETPRYLSLPFQMTGGGDR